MVWPRISTNLTSSEYFQFITATGVILTRPFLEIRICFFADRDDIAPWLSSGVHFVQQEVDHAVLRGWGAHGLERPTTFEAADPSTIFSIRQSFLAQGTHERKQHG